MQFGKQYKVNKATARINGLTKEPYYWEHHGYYTWDVLFSDTSTLFLENITFIKMGCTKEEAESFWNEIKENFEQAGICEGQKVNVLYGPDCNVRAIGFIGKDVWIDTCDKFAKKTFKELNVAINT